MYYLPWQGLSVFLFCQLCCLSVIFISVSGLWGLVPGVFVDYGDSNVRQRGNKNWNNVHRRARLPNAMCIDMQALMLVHCQGLCRHFFACPLVFPCHVTCHQTQHCLLYLPPCPFYLFHSLPCLLLVSLQPSGGLPSPPHDTVSCATLSHDESISTHMLL